MVTNGGIGETPIKEHPNSINTLLKASLRVKNFKYKFIPESNYPLHISNPFEEAKNKTKFNCHIKLDHKLRLANDRLKKEG